MNLRKALEKRYNEKQIKIGIKVEYEHTDDPKKAEKIAKDHLDEDPKYYDKLLVMEGKGKHSKTEKMIIEWFRRNPNPSDDQVHEFAESKNISSHKLEEAIYKIVTKYVTMIKE